MKVQKMENGRTMLTLEGEPLLVKLALRESTTSPTRIKACLFLDATPTAVPLPFAQAVIGTGKRSNGKDKTPNGWTPEFRLEMN